MFGKTIRRKMFLLGGAYAAWKYFFDPEQGDARRASVQEQIAALRGGGANPRSSRGSLEEVGNIHASTSPPVAAPVAIDDTLKERIESEVLLHDEWPKGRLYIDVAGGVVTIRGELDSSERVAELEQEIRKVSGVVDVENLVHLPTEAPPNKADALKASRKAEKDSTS